MLAEIPGSTMRLHRRDIRSCWAHDAEKKVFACGLESGAITTVPEKNYRSKLKEHFNVKLGEDQGTVLKTIYTEWKNV